MSLYNIYFTNEYLTLSVSITVFAEHSELSSEEESQALAPHFQNVFV